MKSCENLKFDKLPVMKAKRPEINELPLTLKSHPGKCVKLSSYIENHWYMVEETCELSDNPDDAIKIFIDKDRFR